MNVATEAAYSERDLGVELQELRHGLLRMLMVLGPLTSWVWLYYAVSHNWEPGVHAIPTATVCIAALGAYRLSDKRPKAATWLLLVGMALGFSAFAALYPSSLAVASGVLVVVLSVPLLDTREAALIAILSCVGALAAGDLATHGRMSAGRSQEIAALYGLAFGGCWLAARPLRSSVQLALAGWGQARSSLLEIRQRRGELFRVVRALEEATYRIERMNNELIVARREAEEARALKARFVATVSHELRGPMNLILGFSRLMALSPKSYEQPLPRCYRADIHTIYRNCQHVLALVDDILDLSQIEAQRLPLVRDRVDLEDDVVRKAVGIVESLMERKGLTLRLELAGNLPWVLADQVRLRQALLNLLINAVRFTERGGITVRTAQRDNAVLVSVQDTGAGIAEADLPKLFREFSQVRSQGVEETGGSGLGLAISKQLIQLHGGEIWVESRQGVGTTFTFSVPLPGTESYAVTPLKTSDVERHLGTQTCLVIHDDADMVRLMARHITGYRMVGLPDEKDLVALTDELHPRAIIVGPDDAEQAARELTRTDFDVPLITCTSKQIGRIHPFIYGHFIEHLAECIYGGCGPRCCVTANSPATTSLRKGAPRRNNTASLTPGAP